MIISIHIRKAGGRSFSKSLHSYYQDRLLLDYGDEIGSNWDSSIRKRKKRLAILKKKKNNIANNFEIIHGHFFAPKYNILNIEKQYFTIVRNPIERVLSNYFYLRRNKNRKNPDARIVNEFGFSLEEYITYPDARNVQCQFLSGIPFENFSAIGLVEEYEKSLSLFNKIFNARLVEQGIYNQNLSKESNYNVSKQVISLIKENNKEDIELYNFAKNKFNIQYKKLIEKSKRIHLVIGVSNAGKSSFISKYLKNSLNLSIQSILWANRIKQQVQIKNQKKYIVHYNLLRELNKFPKTPEKIPPIRGINLEDLLTLEEELNISVLVTSKKTILNRLINRIYVEPLLKEKKARYLFYKNYKQLNRVNLSDLYIYLFNRLDSKKITYKIIDSSDYFFKEINREVALQLLEPNNNFFFKILYDIHFFLLSKRIQLKFLFHKLASISVKK